jgi:D-cysteine desulfhydrase
VEGTDVPRVRLANLPTPLQRLDRLSAELGAELWVKRDDLTGCALSGNKVRKLETLCGEALAQGADTLVTCGAVTSNHARATAVAAARLGMGSHLVLRGEPRRPPDGNLLLDRLLGAGTTFISAEAWPRRSAILAEVAERLRAGGRRPYVIPEGGSNAVGAWGYVRAAAEIADDARRAGLELRRVVHAIGSGGTTAGLALGFAGTPGVEVLGVAVCDDRATFDAVVGRICEAFRGRGWGPAEGTPRWRILEGYQGAGYARTTPEEMAFLARVARSEGLVLDPVYTGKALRGLVEELRAGRLDGGATVFVHTGGLYGLFSFADAVGALDVPAPLEVASASDAASPADSRGAPR